MSSRLRRIVVALSSGLFQSPSYLLPQFIAAIAMSVGASAGQLAWLVPLGYALPVLAGLLLAAGDWFGGRVLIVGLAALTLLGVSLVATAGLVAGNAPALALGMVMAGACLIPAAVRHGGLVVAYETRGLAPDKQLEASQSLRRYLVLGIYLVPLPAGLVAGRHGWVSAFALLALVQVGALGVLVGVTEPERRGARPSLRAFGRDLVAGFKDGRLIWAAAGAFAAQVGVFTFVGGLPVHLAAQGYSTAAISAVSFAGIVAVVFVVRPKNRGSAVFGRWAGAAPVTGALLFVAVAVTAAALGGAGAAVSVAQLAALGLNSTLIELSRQWSQSLALLQARAGARKEQDYRRQAVVGLGANVGAIAGAWLGPWSAGHGQAVWAAALLATTSLAWMLQASWFASFGPRADSDGEQA